MGTNAAWCAIQHAFHWAPPSGTMNGDDMRGKAALVVGLATGYVLGTRDGRVRYQQIKTQFNRVISDPRVQEKTAQATDLAKEKAPLVKDKLADVTEKATSKATSKSTGKSTSKVSASEPGSDLPEQTTVSAPDLTHSSTEAKHSSDSVDSGDSVSADTSIKNGPDDELDDEIILTPPSPSPLAPGPTQTDSSAPTTGGSHG